MTTIHILYYCLPLALSMFVYAIFQDFWFSSYGARRPWKQVRLKAILLVPIALALIGVFSLFTSGWSDLLEVFPKLCLIAIIVPATFQLIRWKRRPTSIDVPLDVVVKSRYPLALRIDPLEHMSEDDPRRPMFEQSDTYMIPNANIATLATVLAEHLRLTGHIIEGFGDYEAIRFKALALDYFRISSLQQFDDAEATSWLHQIVHDKKLGLISIHSDAVA